MIKLLAFVGTIALLLVAGGIFVHNIDYLHHVLPDLPAIVREFGAGLIVGIVTVLIVLGFKKIFGKKKEITETTSA